MYLNLTVSLPNILARTLVALSALVLLAGCDSSNTENAPTNGALYGQSSAAVNGGPSDGAPPATGPVITCARYVDFEGTISEEAYEGEVDEDGNCVYDVDFASPAVPITTDLTLARLPNNGAHVFASYLIMGSDFANTLDSTSDLSASTTLTIAPGAIIAFQNEAFMAIRRGSRIIADGTPDAPITFTSYADIMRADDADDVANDAEWGGLIIAGRGLANRCQYARAVAGAGDLRIFEVDDPTTLASDTPALILEDNSSATTDCRPRFNRVEGDIFDFNIQSGGLEPADNSGVLDHVIIKHAGATIPQSDRRVGFTGEKIGVPLNLSDVGSGTRLSNIQIYAAAGDGLSIRGGGFDIENLLISHVKDNAIDIGGGFFGNINRALIVQHLDAGATGYGDACIYVRNDDDPAVNSSLSLVPNFGDEPGMNTRLGAQAVTCIFSPTLSEPAAFTAAGTGTVTEQTRGNGKGSGMTASGAVHFELVNSLIIGSRTAVDITLDDDNRCLDIASVTTGGLSSVITSCKESSSLPASSVTAFTRANVLEHTVTGDTADPSAAAVTGLQLLRGIPLVFSIPITGASVNGAALGSFSAMTEADGSIPPFIGAVSTPADNRWAWAFDVFTRN